MNVFTSKLRAIGVFNKRELIALQGSIFQRSFHPTLARQRRRKNGPTFDTTPEGFAQVVKELVHVREKLKLPDDRMPSVKQLLKHTQKSYGSKLCNAIRREHGGPGAVAIRMGWLTKHQAKSARKRAEKGLPPLSKEEMIAAVGARHEPGFVKSPRKRILDFEALKLRHASTPAPCRYGNECSREECWFTHPRDVSD